jgi:hypothetical protein
MYVSVEVRAELIIMTNLLVLFRVLVEEIIWFYQVYLRTNLC